MSPRSSAGLTSRTLRCASQGVTTAAADASASAAAAAAANGKLPRRGDRPGGGQGTGREEGRAGDRDEIPVVVDERVHEPERQSDRERRRCVALGALEAPHGPDGGGRGGGHEPEQERQPDDPRSGEELERHAVRLRHRGCGLAVALACDLEGVRAGAGERVGLEDVARLAPPGEAVVRAQAHEPAGIVPDLLTTELVRDPAGVGDEPDDGHERDSDREPAQQPRDPSPSGRRQRPPSELASAKGDKHAAGEQEQSEPGAVGDSIRVRPAVLDERRPRERPTRDRPRGHDRNEHEQCRIDPVAAEPEPEHDPEHRRRDTRARGGEQDRDHRRVGERCAPCTHRNRPRRGGEGEREHEQDIGGERERVPVADRVAQPGGAAAVRKDRRDRLARQRPDDAGAERDRQRRGGEPRGSRPHRAEQEADGEEGDVDERPVELGPGEIRRHRPRDREPAPGRRREQQHAEQRSSAGQRRPTGQCERSPATGNEQRGKRGPDRVSREHGAQQQRGRDGHRHFGPPHRGPS